MDVRLKSQWQIDQAHDPRKSLPVANTSVSPFGNAEATVRWTKLGKLSQVLYPTTSPYGRPVVCFCAPEFLVIGTDSADVLVFDYEQRLLVQLSARSVNAKLGAVTCLNMSDDSTYVVAGFSQGWVCTWELESTSKGIAFLRSTVPPIEPENVPTPRNRVQEHESHVVGTVVRMVAFLPTKHSTFVSLDEGGLLVLHRHHRVLLELTTSSRRLLGSFLNGPKVLDTIMVGSKIAVLTPQLFLVMQIVEESAVELLKVSRSKETGDPDKEHGVVRYNKYSAQLAYSWGSHLKVLKADREAGFVADSAYQHSLPIEWFDWIDPQTGMVAVLSTCDATPQLDLLMIDDAHIVDSEKLSPSLNLLQMQVSASAFFAMGRYEFSIGQLTNWADRLLALLNNAHPTEAIELALSYFADESDISILGLPAERHLRQRVVRSALPDLVLTALKFSIQFDYEQVKRLLPVSIRAAVVMHIDLLESILELVSGSNEQWIHELFLETLVSLVLARKIRQLSPPVFKELVLYRYTAHEIFYLLDLSGLDLDLAFRICAQHAELAEVEIFLRNQALNDFLSPLSPATQHTVGYLAHILTGRVFPTGLSQKNEAKAAAAKAAIYHELFLTESSAVLQSIIDRDERGLFTALNEAFEDPFLNDSPDISRQVIVNLLQGPAITTHGPYLSIFLARNYPKYRQFLVFPGQVLEQVSMDLCEPNDEQEESELALLSLLSVTKPTKMQKFMSALVAADYALVLEYLYRKQEKFRDLIFLKLTHHHKDMWAAIEEGFLRDKSVTAAVVHENLSQLLVESPARLAALVMSQLRDTDVWSDVLALGDDNQHRVEFLNAIFGLIGSHGGPLPPASVNSAYVSMLAREPAEGGGKLMDVLRKLLTGPKDIQLPMVVDDLISSGHIDALVVMLDRLDRKNEAMIYLLNHLPALSDNNAELSRYTDMAISLCVDSTTPQSSAEKGDGVKLWKRLLEALMALDNDAAQEQIRKVIRILSESGSTSTIEVAADLISADGKGVVPVLSQLFLDLHRQERALHLFHSILQRDGFKQLVEVLAGRAEGWAVSVDGECEICGRKIVGLGIDATKLYKAWQQNLQSDPKDIKEVSKEDQKERLATGDALIVFQCRHSYHFKCLSRMIGDDLTVPSLRYCVLCDRD